jgi:hypothetical protein
MSTHLILTQYRIQPSKFRFMRQGVTISGFDSASFGLCRHGMDHIASFLQSGCTEPGVVKVPDSVFSGSYPAIEASNRYFTPRKDSDGSDICPFPMSYDPNGALSSMLGDDLVFTTDNIVVFSERKEVDGETR